MSSKQDGQLGQNDGRYFHSSMALDIFNLSAKSTTTTTTTTTTTMINISLIRS